MPPATVTTSPDTCRESAGLSSAATCRATSTGRASWRSGIVRSTAPVVLLPDAWLAREKQRAEKVGGGKGLLAVGWR